MAVSFLKHRDALVDAWKKVLDTESDTLWAVFGYEGKSFELKVVETGDDLDEMVDELSGSKIMYAFVSIKDPNTSLQKYVFINWQGEGAPTTQKGTCARHVSDVAKLFRGAHVTINARTEDDVEIDELVQKVAKASGANYSFHKETSKPQPAIGPVGAVYKKTRADIEIRQNRSDDFWQKTEEEERLRVAQEKQSKIKEKQSIEQERKSREIEEAKRRENQSREKSRIIDEAKSKEKAALEKSRDDEQKRWEAKQATNTSPSKPPPVASRKKEAAEMVAARTNNPKAFFEKKASAPPPRPPAKEPIRLPKNDFVQGEVVEAEPEPETVQEPEPSYEPVQEPEPTYESKPSYEPEPIYETEPADEPPALPPPREDAKAAMPLPTTPYQPESDEEPPQDDDDWEEPANQQVPEDNYEPDATYGNIDETVPESAYSDLNTQDEYEPQSSGVNIRAKVVYDYQAGDDSEITFDVDDIIENIDKIDDGWWMGTGPDGRYGMFPANYVEEI
ncbi:drebrin-like protein [Antedon mediterranea]|uniref:drebrin-like protein n=1 Tax=Antedon mediterranea TaxID=105859 RepID=UPI003AF74E78